MAGRTWLTGCAPRLPLLHLAVVPYKVSAVRDGTGVLVGRP